MRSHAYPVFSLVISASILMVLSIIFPVAGSGFLHIEDDLLLLGVSIGSILTLIIANLRFQPGENAEPWLRHERSAWTLIGTGCLLWALGQCFWMYIATTHQTSSFTFSYISLGNLGLGGCPIVIFLGLLFLPFSGTGYRRTLVLLDTFISAGSLFAISWFLLLGPLTLEPGKDLPTRLLYLYYPTTDVILPSYLLFLFLRGAGHSQARRISLLALGLGLTIFATFDFIGNVQLNAGTYVEGTWVDLGWPIGIMIIGLAAYLRRFLPTTIESESEKRVRQQIPHIHLGLIQLFPYLLAAFPMLVLLFNVLFPQKNGLDIRPVLTIVTLLVVGLVIIRQIVTMLENERLIREQAETLQQLEEANQDLAQHMALKAEIDVAARIQSQLLLQKLPQIPGLDIYMHSHPAEQVGGDFYDFSAHENLPFVFAIGDVSGKGLPAALLMAMTRTVLHTAARSMSTVDPQAILVRVNEDLREDFIKVWMFATTFVGCYDPSTAQLCYANAGHSPVVYCPAGGQAVLLKADAPVLGVRPTSTYINHTLIFHPNDVLIAGTDGLNESFNARGEMFGYERLLKTVEKLAPLSSSQIGLELLNTIEQFTKGCQQFDDQTFIIFKGVEK
jgi:sigma-B regulation protein RsbU (phosphoserine phosphatase)